MPYITEEDRMQVNTDLLFGDTPDLNPGRLNYVITNIIKEYLDQHGACYATYNEIVGVLECAKLELYRRLISPYEDTKLEENGDVY